jgi:streptogramin lyase
MLLLIGTTLSAQAPVPLHFETLSFSNGLSQGYVSDITQDKKGLMWFTTGDGLNRYDGYSFTVFHNDIQDTTSISSDDLTCVFEDTKQRLWVGTRNNGLDLFNRETNTFTHFVSRANGLRSNAILGIREDSSGALWIRTIAGIDRMDINSEKLFSHQYTATSIIIDNGPKPVGRPPENIFIDSRNRIYITTNNKVLELMFNRHNKSYRLLPRFSFTPANPYFMPEMLEDTVHHCFLLNNKNIIKFPDYNFNYPQYIYPYAPVSISWAIDQNQALWITDSIGVTQLDINSGNARKIIAKDPLQMKPLTFSTVFYKDKTGIVWLGSSGYGIIKYDPEIERFHHSLEGQNVYQLTEYVPGVIATNNLSIIDTRTKPPLVDESHSAAFLKNFGGLAPLYLAKDTSNNIWGGKMGALIQYNVKTRLFKHIDLPYKDILSDPYPVYADKTGNIWMGYRQFVVQYNISSGNFNRYPYPVSQSVVDYDFLQAIYDDDGLIWFGSTNGLFCLDTQTGQMKTPFFFSQTDTNTISNNFILSFCQDIKEPSRFLWIGTKGGGLNRLDKYTGRFERFTTKKGLANNVVYGILYDYDGNLWMSTNKGLSVLHTVNKTFRNFDINDGLQGNEFNRYAYCRTTSGDLVFGGLNGINLFDPRSIQPLESPDVVLTGLRLFNRQVKAGLPESPLEKEIEFTNELELLYEQNVVTFRFAAMDYRKHNTIQYRYKMDGFDEDWIYSGTINEATYTNLDPGEYHFLVQAGFNGNNWTGHTKKLNIFIMAPWWKTWWFKVFVIIGTVSVAYALYRYRIHQLIRLDSLRNRIARDLHDEVGSSISTIAIYSKIVHEQMENETFNNEPLLQKITDHATEIMESMNDIVWNINTKNDAFEHIISRMRENAFQLLEAKGYTLHFDFDEQLYQMQLPMEKRRDFYLIYKEAINNIAKYAEGENVWIALSLTSTGIHLMIKDDGKGFDQKLIRKGANGLVNMEHRANMLNGKFSMTSEPGKGTEFHLDF